MFLSEHRTPRIWRRCTNWDGAYEVVCAEQEQSAAQHLLFLISSTFRAADSCHYCRFMLNLAVKLKANTLKLTDYIWSNTEPRNINPNRVSPPALTRGTKRTQASTTHTRKHCVYLGCRLSSQYRDYGGGKDEGWLEHLKKKIIITPCGEEWFKRDGE